VQLVAYQDHHPYSDADVAILLNAATATDYVVVTEKDAVKLRPRWPADAREPLVATLGVQWERGQRAIEALLTPLIDSSTPVI
jgi:tetraacyldisaccharide-1-P 4'-kinase